MAYCDSIISAGIESPCSVRKGIKRYGKIYNRSQISNAGIIPDGNLLSTISSTGSAYDVVVPGNQPFNGLSQSMSVGTYDTTFSTDIPIVILENNPNVAQFIKKLSSGEFVLVLENNDDGGGNGKYQVYGWENGLTASEATREPYGDNPGWTVTLHEEGASEPAIFLAGDGWTGTVDK